MSEVDPANRLLARFVIDRFAGQPSVISYWDDDHRFRIDMVECRDAPTEGVTSYGTIGLSDHPLQVGDTGRTVCLELLGACENGASEFGRVLTTAVFYAIRRQWRCAPGSILEDVLPMYGLSATLKHLLFVPQFLWDGFHPSKFGHKLVHWLQAVPITDAERRFAARNGPHALERLFEHEQIDVFDIQRASVLWRTANRS